MYNYQMPQKTGAYQEQYHQYQAPDEDINEGKSYFTGFIGAILGALVGAIPWALVYYFGWFVGILGFVIGFLAFKGYDMLRGKSGKGKIVIVLFSAMIGVLVGNLLGDCITVGAMISNGEIDGAVMSDIPSIIIYTLFTSIDYLRDFVVSIAIGIVFVVLGMVSLFKNMSKSK